MLHCTGMTICLSTSPTMRNYASQCLLCPEHPEPSSVLLFSTLTNHHPPGLLQQTPEALSHPYLTLCTPIFIISNKWCHFFAHISLMVTCCLEKTKLNLALNIHISLLIRIIRMFGENKIKPCTELSYKFVNKNDIIFQFLRFF